MTVDDNTNEINGDASTSDQQPPALDTITCLDIAWSAVRRPFHFLPGVNPLEFAALFSPLARAFQHLKRQQQPPAPVTTPAPSQTAATGNSQQPQPEPAKPTSEETGKNTLTMTHAEFRDFLLGVQAAFNGFPDLWTRFLDLALKFMQAHSSHPPSPGPAPNPA